MDVTWRRRCLAGGLLLAVFGIGCNPLTSVYFLMVGVDPKFEPEFRLANQDKETRVLVLAYSAPDVRTDATGIDRQLGTTFVRQLEERCKGNKEKIYIVPIHKVEKFKNDNISSWKQMSATEIGRVFDVDYVIDLEVVSLALYEPDSHRSLFRGRCKIDMAVHDLRKPHEGPVFKTAFSTEYPKTRGPIPVADDNNVDKFRDMFINRIATDICWKLTAHLSQEEYKCD
jgi:hypothetical protein